MEKIPLIAAGFAAGAAVGGLLVYASSKKTEDDDPDAFHELAPAEINKEGRGQRLYKKGKTVIPGGVGLLSKRPENHLPGQWPSYYKTCGPGPYVVDMDDRRYMDCAYGTCYSALGFNDPDVNAAVKAAVDGGNMCTLNCPEEVELAQKLLDLHPWSEGGSCRFARGGGEINTIAVRIARAYTGKDKVAFCGYHGWPDFYLAANVGGENLGSHLIPGLKPAGVPSGLGGTMLPWRYNHLEDLEKIFQENKGEIAMIIMEPMRSELPHEGFFKRVRELATEHNAVLCIDEVSGGFRENLGGRHLEFGVKPDMVTFAKTLGNGYAIAAVLGIQPVMDKANETFMSSSFWTEKIGTVAALATIKKMEKLKVFDHCKAIGNKVRAGWQKAAEDAGLKVKVSALQSWPSFGFEHDELNQTLRTLWKQEMLKLGVLAGCQFMVMYTFKEKHLELYLDAVTKTFTQLGKWLQEYDGDQAKLQKHVDGELEYPGFARICK